jgi:hypothetical protein
VSGVIVVMDVIVVVCVNVLMGVIVVMGVIVLMGVIVAMGVIVVMVVNFPGLLNDKQFLLSNLIMISFCKITSYLSFRDQILKIRINTQNEE